MILETLARELREQGEAAFRQRYASPVLLLVSDVSSESEAEFHTAFARRGTPAIGVSPKEAVGSDAVDRVLRIVKRPDGPFEDRIGLGRARNADVHVPLRHLSKYHAYVTWSADGTRYFLSDAGSKNGTKIAGVTLAPREPTPLVDGCTVHLGPYEMLFFTPAGLIAAAKKR
jgi:hypothetical protein